MRRVVRRLRQRGGVHDGVHPSDHREHLARVGDIGLDALGVVLLRALEVGRYGVRSPYLGAASRSAATVARPPFPAEPVTSTLTLPSPC